MGVMDPEVEGQIEHVVSLVQEILVDVVNEMKAAKYAKATGALVHAIRDLQTCGPFLDKYYSEAEWEELAASGWKPEGIDRWLSNPENKAYYDEREKRYREHQHQVANDPQQQLRHLIRRLFGE